jgi:phage N-6-adenine-methyltransferase
MVQSGVITLNEIEQTELAQHEATIRRGIGTFIEVGTALLAIRDGQLFRDQYDTFEDYCQERWGFNSPHARRLIRAAETVSNIQNDPIGSPLPTHESQIRPITTLRTAEEQRAAWQKAVETAPETGITAGHVQRVVDEMTHSEPEERKEPEVKTVVRFTGYSSATPEHYTPREIIDAVIACMGEIDLDPCSNSHADPNVPAEEHYTAEDNGLAQEWHGRIYMNPPYGREIGAWVEKLCQEHYAGHTLEAIALVPARTDTQWWQQLRDFPVCFVTGRLKFGDLEDSAPFPSAVFYLGNDVDHFYYAFEHLGDIWQRIEPGMFAED